MARQLLRSAVLGLFAFALPGVSSAADPPARVARLSYVEGPVSFRPGGVDEWAPAARNRPLTIGDSIWTDRDGRCELQLGTLTVRLGPETSFGFLNLDDNVTQMQVTRGSARISVRSITEGEALELDTPTAALSLLQPGVLRPGMAKAPELRPGLARRT